MVRVKGVWVGVSVEVGMKVNQIGNLGQFDEYNVAKLLLRVDCDTYRPDLAVYLNPLVILKWRRKQGHRIQRW